MPREECYQNLLACLAELDCGVLYPEYVGSRVAEVFDAKWKRCICSAVERFYGEALIGNEWKIFDEKTSSDEIGAYNIEECKKAGIFDLETMLEIENISERASRVLSDYLFKVISSIFEAE